jgi:hypothetical protein
MAHAPVARDPGRCAHREVGAGHREQLKLARRLRRSGTERQEGALDERRGGIGGLCRDAGRQRSPLRGDDLPLNAQQRLSDLERDPGRTPRLGHRARDRQARRRPSLEGEHRHLTDGRDLVGIERNLSRRGGVVPELPGPQRSPVPRHPAEQAVGDRRPVRPSHDAGDPCAGVERDPQPPRGAGLPRQLASRNEAVQIRVRLGDKARPGEIRRRPGTRARRGNGARRPQ